MLRVFKKLPAKKLTWVKSQPPTYWLYKTTSIESNPNLSSLTTIRQYSSQRESDKSGGGGSGVLLAVGALVLTGGATLAYAKYDSDFRKTLTSYAPFTDSIIKTLWQEADGSGNIVSSSYKTVKSSVVGLISGNKDGKSLDLPPVPKEYKAPPPIVPVIEKEILRPEPAYNEIRLEKLEKKGAEPVVELVGDTKPVATSSATSDAAAPAQAAELEEKLCRSAEEAVNAYNNAIYIVKLYNQDIEYILDEAVNDVSQETWDSVRSKTRSKIECLRRAQEKAAEAQKDINRLKEMVSSSSFDAPASAKDMIKNNISKVQDDIDKAKKELDVELKQGSVTEKYWAKVEKARQHFSVELESLFPNIDLSKKRLTVSEEDLDLFVLHTYSNILFYQKELAKMETVLQEKINAAVEAARKSGGGEALSHAQICEALEQEKRRLMLCFQQKVLKMRREHELELREQLKLQSQAFSDHLEDAIKTREMEIERNLARKYDEMLEQERCKYKIQLSAIVGRLQGLDKAIKEKTESDETSKQAQVLWSACQALLRAIKAGCPGIPWKDQIRPLEPELTAVEKASAENDELVTAVLKAIPKEARERGVYPEDALRERFLKVEKVALTVALVPEEGASLPIHILSYLQSLLLIKAASPIPQSELNDEKVDFSQLTTGDILQRARYWLDRGDFAQTLRYMNLLKGAPRCVARQWMNETRILLETQQAANTLMAHAASSGLMYL